MRKGAGGGGEGQRVPRHGGGNGGV